MELVLADVPARVARQLQSRTAYTEIQYREAVVAHQATAMCGYPHKAIGVGIDVVYIIIRQPMLHVQVQHVEPLGTLLLCMEAE